MSSESYRLASCEGCRAQLRFCGRCDRGQRYCPPCRLARRRASLRRAGASYRQKRRAQRLSAARQARYRERRGNFTAQKVTHPTVTDVVPSPTSPSPPEISFGVGKEDDVSSALDAQGCSLCGAALPVWVRRHRRAPRRSLASQRRAPRVPRGPPVRLGGPS